MGSMRLPLFLLTALAWLLASMLLGLYLWIAREFGLPLSAQLRVIHVHAALVGGVAQIIFGALLTFIPALLTVPFTRKKKRLFQYVLLNLGAIGMVVGFATINYPIVGFSGLAIGLAFLMLLSETLSMVRKSLSRPSLHLWFYGLAVLSLLGGIVLGVLIAFEALAPESINLARLAHLHVNLLGFVTLSIVGTMHMLFPSITSVRLWSERLAIMAFLLLPLGVITLVAGFLLSAPLIQVVAGVIFLSGVSAYGTNMVATWWMAQTRSTLPVLHVLFATGWLALTVIVGILLTWNTRTDPPAYPIGTAHLMGYSHMALVGFIVQTIIGALSHLLPLTLALDRVKSQKKRRPYLELLTSVVERWKWLQLGTLNLGILGMAGWGLAAGVFGLGAQPTVLVLWSAVALLSLGVGLFAEKVGSLLMTQPTRD
jgi:hypothetical protein